MKITHIEISGARRGVVRIIDILWLGSRRRLQLCRGWLRSHFIRTKPGGGGENRTPVRKAKPINVYMFIPNFKFTATAPPDWII